MNFFKKEGDIAKENYGDGIVASECVLDDEFEGGRDFKRFRVLEQKRMTKKNKQAIKINVLLKFFCYNQK